MKKLILLFILFTLVVMIAVSFILRPAKQEMMGLEPVHSINIPSVPECDVSITTCQAVLGEYSLSFRINSVVRPLNPFSVSLEAEGWQPEQAAVYFSMQGMEMGLNRFKLKQVADVWQGQAMLPVCTDQRSDWLATVFVSHNGQRYRSVFSFTVQ